MPRTRSFGTIGRLPSGNYRAVYRHHGGRHTAPTTFEDREAASIWLRNERRLIEDDPLGWTPPRDRARAALTNQRRRGVLFGEYARAWLASRRGKGGRPLSPTTNRLYKRILDEHLVPEFGDAPLSGITPEDIDHWHALLLPHAPTMRAHTYSLLRTILGTATDHQLIRANPAKVRGAGTTERVHQVKPATLEELAVIIDNMPARYQLMVLLAAWCALRFGELTELRRSDIAVGRGVIHVRRGVIWVDGKPIVKEPKTAAGKRDVAIPPHLMPAVRQHLLEHTAPGGSGLLFPAPTGGHLSAATFKGVAARTGSRRPKTGYGFYEARVRAGRPDLRFHDLRHTGATMAAQTGATLAELMGRLGHTTAAAAIRYQHAAAERDAEIAKRLSAMAKGQV